LDARVSTGRNLPRQRWKRDRALRIAGASPTPELDEPLNPALGEEPSVLTGAKPARSWSLIARDDVPPHPGDDGRPDSGCAPRELLLARGYRRVIEELRVVALAIGQPDASRRLLAWRNRSLRHD